MPDKFKPWDDLKIWEDMSPSEQMKSLRWDVSARLRPSLHLSANSGIRLA